MAVMALEATVASGNGKRLTTTEAVCRLCWHLFHGEAMTTEQAAQLTGLTTHGAYQMLCRMARYLPITQDPADRETWMLEAVLAER